MKNKYSLKTGRGDRQPKNESFAKGVIFSATALFLLLFISFVSALGDDAGTSIDFTYETPINYSLIPTVNSSDYWDELDTPSDISYDDLSGGDVNDIGYYGYFNGLGGVVGGLAMDGDPWYIGGTDLEIDQNLQVNNTYVEHDIMPTDTLTGNIGSGALRWLTLWVQNISAEDIDTYTIHASDNITTDSYFVGNGSYLTDLTETDPIWENEKVSYYNTTQVNDSYLLLDGSNADQDIDIGSYDFEAGNSYIAEIGGQSFGLNTYAGIFRSNGDTQGVLLAGDTYAFQDLSGQSWIDNAGMSYFGTSVTTPIAYIGGFTIQDGSLKGIISHSDGNIDFDNNNFNNVGQLDVNGNIDVGNSVAGVDYILSFSGEDSTGTILHDEDNAIFKLNQGLNSTGVICDTNGCIGFGRDVIVHSNEFSLASTINTINMTNADPDYLFGTGELNSEALAGTYSNGEAYVCVYDNGTIYAKDSACS